MDVIEIEYSFLSVVYGYKLLNSITGTWDGRRMKTFTKTDGTAISYTYNGDGIRTSKTVGSEKVEYLLDGTNIIREIRDAYTLTFLYDAGTLVGFNYDNGSTNANYYYGIDNFGNINYIYDASGNIVVTYRYDAWGKHISTTGTLASTIGAANPYRYKSYYYDTETGLYYLQSRYYDAGVQRFLNEDDVAFLGAGGNIYSYNSYVYCDNDPVNDSDPSGMFSVGDVINFIKSLGWKALKAISSIWQAFKQPGKIMLKPFEVVIDVAINMFVPSVGVALKLVTYKRVTKALVETAFKSAGKSLITVLTKMGLKIGLNTLFAAAVNNLIFNQASRFLTIGGIVCLILDVIDGNVDYWFNYGK